jgi:hypothetical protein
LEKLSLTFAVIVRENSIWHFTYDEGKSQKKIIFMLGGKSTLDFGVSVVHVHGKNTLLSGDLTAWSLM